MVSGLVHGPFRNRSELLAENALLIQQLILANSAGSLSESPSAPSTATSWRFDPFDLGVSYQSGHGLGGPIRFHHRDPPTAERTLPWA